MRLKRSGNALIYLFFDDVADVFVRKSRAVLKFLECRRLIDFQLGFVLRHSLPLATSSTVARRAMDVCISA